MKKIETLKKYLSYKQKSQFPVKCTLKHLSNHIPVQQQFSQKFQQLKNQIKFFKIGKDICFNDVREKTAY